jgi:hypothetical protein
MSHDPDCAVADPKPVVAAPIEIAQRTRSVVHDEKSPPRDMRLDSLRGLMLVGMAINHIASPLRLLTDHPLGYTTSAEGFVFVSGLVAGLVYTRRLHRLGTDTVLRSSWLRTCTIYSCHVALFIGLLIWSNVFEAVAGVSPGNVPPLMLEHPWAALMSGILLVNQPPLLDILPMYAGFMLLLPGLLAALDARRHALVLSVSFAGWVVTNLFWPLVPLIFGVAQMGAFNWGAWQFLFVLGVTFGHASATGQSLLPRWSLRLVLPALTLCAYCFLIRHWYVPAPFAEFADWVNKNNLAPARLLNTLALFFLVHLAFVRWPRLFVWPPFALLGRHSLAVFSAHVAMAYVLFAFPQYVSSTLAQTWLGTLIMLATLSVVALVSERAEVKHRLEGRKAHPARSRNAPA